MLYPAGLAPLIMTLVPAVKPWLAEVTVMIWLLALTVPVMAGDPEEYCAVARLQVNEVAETTVIPAVVQL